MFTTFSRKFLAIYILTTIVIFLILFGTLSQTITNHFVSSRYRKMFNEIHSIETEYYDSYIQGTLDESMFHNQLYTYSYRAGSRIIIIDPDQRVIFDSEPSSRSLMDTIINHDYARQSISGETVTQIGTFKPYEAEQVIAVASPLKYEETLYGAVILTSPYPSIKEDIRYVYNLILISFIVIIFVTFISTYVFSRSISQTFKAFNATAKSIASGDFSARIEDTHFSTEVIELAESMNYMAEELEKLEDLRRDFIANISHDFRSPLTSIRGYVQAVMDGTIPPEKYEKYLTIVLNETDRLTKLTNDILLLTKMENEVLKPEMEDFDLHETLRNTLLQFEQKILQKKIKMTLIIEDEDILVHADYNQIQRALTNLIDNALKFCENGDEVTLETTLIGDQVRVSVKDTGPGIAEDDLKHIWTRFHKADRSRGKDKKGVGLGLSIVREIIKGHHQTVDVYSQLGKGTTFTFTLAIAKKNNHHL
jgi:signal transduction histidine kinase